MDGEEFYDFYIESLRYLDIKWADKARVRITIENDCLVMSRGKRKTCAQLTKKVALETPEGPEVK